MASTTMAGWKMFDTRRSQSLVRPEAFFMDFEGNTFVFLLTYQHQFFHLNVIYITLYFLSHEPQVSPFNSEQLN